MARSSKPRKPKNLSREESQAEERDEKIKREREKAIGPDFNAKNLRQQIIVKFILELMGKGKKKQEIVDKLFKEMNIVGDDLDFVNECLEKIED
ncbi:MAG TPA: hypothetical protein VJK05_06045 [archaeon]|nr:hypothetical protein [archaeon]